MPTYTMTGPDGRVYQLQAGDDVPRERVEAELRRRISVQLGQQAQATPSPAAPAPAAQGAPALTPQQRQAVAQRESERGFFGRAFDKLMGNEIEAPEAYTPQELAARAREIREEQKKLTTAAARFDQLASEAAKQYQSPNAPDRAAGLAQRAQAARDEAAALARELETITKTGLKVPEASTTRETLSSLFREPAAGLMAIPGGIEYFAGRGLGAVGADRLGKYFTETGASDIDVARQYAESAFGAPGEALQYDPTAQLAADVGGGVGTMASFLLPGGAARLAGAGRGLQGAARAEAIANAARPAEYGLGIMQGTQQGIQDIRSYEQRTGQQVPDVNAFAAILFNAGLGATEVGVAGRIFERIPVAQRGAALDAVSNVVRRGTAGRVDPTAIGQAVARTLTDIESRALGRVGVRGAEEALQEMGVQAGTNIIAKGLYDSERDITEGVGYAGLVGGIVGGGLRGGVEIASAIRKGKAEADTDTPLADSPDVEQEYLRLVTNQVEALRAQNPNLTQRQAFNQVMREAGKLYDTAITNILFGAEGGANAQPVTGTTVDVSGGVGAGAAPNLQPTPSEAGAPGIGEAVTGRLGEPVPSVPVPDVGTRAGEPALTPAPVELPKITGAQVKATIPTIEQAFTDNQIDFEEAYGIKKLNAEQKKQAARIVLQSPEVDPYDAIGSVLERGQRLRGETVTPKKAEVTLTPEEQAVEAAKINDAIAGMNERLRNAPSITVPVPTAPTAIDQELAARDQEVSQELLAPEEQPIPTVAETATIEGVTPEPSITPAPTPQQVVENIQSFARTEAQDRGFDPGMFSEGARDAVRDVEPLEDALILDAQGQEALDAYKAGLQYGRERAAEAQAAPDQVFEDVGEPSGNVASLGQRRAERILGKINDLLSGKIDLGMAARLRGETTIQPDDIGDLADDLDDLRKAGLVDEDTFDSLETRLYELEKRLRDQLRPANENRPETPLQKAEREYGEATTRRNDFFYNPNNKGVYADRRTKAYKEFERELDALEADVDAKRAAYDAAWEAERGGTFADIGEAPTPTELVDTPSSNDIFALAEELPEAARVNVRARLDRIMARYEKNGDVKQLLDGLESLRQDVDRRIDRDRAKRGRDRVRGFERAMEVIYRAERTGQLTPEAAGLVRWLLEQNPAIADELAISIREGAGQKAAGQYVPAARLATIFASRANDGTATHEVLHHTERLMPERVREGIRAAWMKRIQDLIALADKTNNADMRAVLGTIVEAYYGDANAQKALKESFEAGTIPYSVYHLANPSEFWAVNATDLIGRRAARTGWLGAARTWLNDFVETVKNFFGLPNNAAVITGIKAIMAVESGTIRGEMLSAGTRDFMMYAGKAAHAANRSKLAEAQALEAAGALSGPTGTTRAKTGWFRGVDGEWRFEISDRDMQFKEGYTPSELKEGRTYLLGQIIDHPELFKQYPDLQKINVVVSDAAGDAGGHWDAERNEIVISNRAAKKISSYLDTLVHELQHAVQTWEGFASGAHYKQYPLSLDAINKALSFLDKNNGQPLFMWGEYYRADRLGDMQNWLQHTRDTVGDLLQQDNDFLRSYYQRRAEIATDRRNRTQAAEVLWREGNHPEAVKLRELRDARIAAADRMVAPSLSSEERAALRSQYDAASAAESAQAKYVHGMIGTGVVPTPDMRDLDAADDYLTDKRAEVFARRDELNDRLARVGVDKLMYYLTAGEVEARDTEQRREKLDEEREATPPYVGERFGSPSDMITVNPYTGTSAAPPQGPPKVVSNGKPVVLTEAQTRTALVKAKAYREKMNRIQKRIAATNDTADVLGDGIELVKLARGDKENWALLRGAIDTLDVGKWQLILPTLSTEDIFRILKDRLPGLTEADRITRQDIPRFQTKEYFQLAEQLEQVADFLKKYPKAAQALSDLEFATVAYQVDPTKATTAEDYFNRVDGKAKELRAKIKGEKDAKKKGRLEANLKQRFNEIVSVYKGVPGDERVIGWRDLSRPEFGGGKGREIFKLLRDAHRRDLEAKYDALRTRLMETKEDEALDEALEKLEAQFKPARDQVIYFPAMRFGSYYARVGSGANSIFKMFESRLKRDQFVRVMQKRGEEVTDTGNVEDLRNNFQQVTGGPLKEVLDLFDGDEKDLGALRSQVFDLWLQTMSAGDMRKHMAPRKMRAGYSTDILKNFANFRRSSINDVKRAKFGYKLRTEISRAKDGLAGAPDREKMNTFIKEIELRTLGNLMPPDRSNPYWEGAIQLGNKAAFYQYLANPKTAVIQLTQLHIVALPMLAQKYGSAKAAAALSKYGFSSLGGFVVSPLKAIKRKDGSFTFDWEQPNLLDNPISALKEESDPELYEVLSEGWNEGRELNLYMDTFANQIGGYGAADPKQRSVLQELMRGRVHTATWRGATFAFEAMGTLMHQMERVNREATYMAALELAYRENKKKGQTHEEAKKNAIDAAVETTLAATFDFSSYNKPRVLTTGVGRLAGQFMSYPYFMTSLLARNMYTAIKFGELEPGERLAAAQTATGALVNIGLYAGLTGLPLYGLFKVIGSMLAWLFDDDDEEGGLSYVDERGNIKATYDIDWWFRNVWIPKFFGPDGTVANLFGLDDGTAEVLARSVEKGPISAITDIDLSNSVALDFMFFVPREPRAETTGGKIVEYTFSALTGAFGNTVMDYVKAREDLMNGYTSRALEKTPRLFGNIAKANRFATEGQLNYNRELVGMGPEFWTSDKAILQALGFASTEADQKQQQNYEAKAIRADVQKAREDFLTKLRKVALDRYQYGPTPEVLEAEKKIREEWVEFNQTYPTDVVGVDSFYEVQVNAVNDALLSRAARGLPMDEKGAKTPYLRDLYLRRLEEERQ